MPLRPFKKEEFMKKKQNSNVRRTKKDEDAWKNAGHPDVIDDEGKSVQASEAIHSAGAAVVGAAKLSGKAIVDTAKATGDSLSLSKNRSIKVAYETLYGLERMWKALKIKAAPVTTEAKADFYNAKEKVSKVLREAKHILVGAKDASEDAWKHKVKPALEIAMKRARQALDDTDEKHGGKEK